MILHFPRVRIQSFSQDLKVDIRPHKRSKTIAEGLGHHIEPEEGNIRS